MTTNANIAAMKDDFSSRNNGKSMRGTSRSLLNLSDLMQQILPEDFFLGMLCVERKRAERSRKTVLLLLLDVEDAARTGQQAHILKQVVQAANAARRETDLAGWYKQDSILGIIFTELDGLDHEMTLDKLPAKVRAALFAQLSAEDLQYVQVSVHVFAHDSNGQDSNISADPTFYPDLVHLHDSKKVPFLLKRFLDIVGSTTALVLISPLLVLIAAIIKITSKGPVLFKQERLGQFGKTFTCLKFRSMHTNNDVKIHQEFMQRLINGKYDGKRAAGSKPVYKMKDDPRVTGIGRFLRRMSLDELPQFINVLKGDMSLVGPRPPIAYEYQQYDIWHRRRVLEIKPGITGLWQVSGRSRVRFDDMVRLDLQYAREWSIWLDMQILARTPRAVLFGDGAY
jgi:exopolysaccharide biosynthesis polyprenyl glycosylphosphotransferase